MRYDLSKGALDPLRHGSGSEDNIAIPVGAFADPAFPAPAFSVYEERMHRWVTMPADIECMD